MLGGRRRDRLAENLVANENAAKASESYRLRCRKSKESSPASGCPLGPWDRAGPAGMHPHDTGLAVEISPKERSPRWAALKQTLE